METGEGAVSDIMSQDEINALLAEVSGAPVEESAKTPPVMIDGKEARLIIHDFKRPHILSGEGTARLKAMCAVACDGIEASLGEYAEITFNRDTMSIDSLTLGEFVRSLGSPTLAAVVDVDPLPGPFAVEVMSSVAYAMLDRLSGRDIRDVTLNLGFTAEEAREARAFIREIAASF